MDLQKEDGLSVCPSVTYLISIVCAGAFVGSPRVPKNGFHVFHSGGV